MGCKSAFVPTVRDEVKAAVERAIEAVVRRLREVSVPGGQAVRSPALPPRRRSFLRRPFSEPRRLAPESLEPRLLFATVTWTNAGGGDWNTASNWDTGSLPGSTDDVVISVAGTPTITHGSGSHTVHSITSDEPFTISGGTLTVTSTVQVNNTFTLNGGTLAGATVNAGSGGQGLTVASHTANRLTGVTMAADVDVTASAAFLRVKDGLTLNGTATLGGTSNPKILLENTETVSGSGSIVFPSSGSAYLLVEGGATATLGSGITVHGGAGSIGDYYVSDTARTLVNQGTISADVSGQTLNVISTNLTFTNQGTAEAKAGSTLAINRVNTSTFTPSNTGTLRADGSNAALRLGGTWAAGAVGTLSSVNGGSVYFGSQGNGTINNTGNTISLGNTSGSWVLDGATVSGGTLGIASGKSLTVTGSSNNRLAGITVNGDLDLTASGAFVRFKDGVALNGTATLGGTSSPKILLENTETVSGTGTIVFPSSGGAELRVESSAAVTLGSGITVRGGAGFIGDSSSVFNSVARSLVNQGTISADVSGQRIFINTENFTFTNQGIVEAKSGGAVYLNTSAYSTLTPSNTGTLRADGSGSAMRLGGTWASGALGALSAVNSGSVHLGFQGTGTINNAASTISLGNTGGSWVLQGATILGGSISIASGASLAVTGYDANRLSGVTVSGNVDMTTSGASLRVKDGLTLNGTVTLGGTSSPKLLLENTETVAGAGTIVFPSSGYASLMVEGGTTATLASGITVRGGAGYIGDYFATNASRTLVNQGTISADVAGQTQFVAGSGFTLTNAGTLQAVSGGLLSVGSAWTNAGIVAVGTGSSVNVSGNFTQTSGATVLQGGVLDPTGAAQIQGGDLSGAGTVKANLANSDHLRPGGTGVAGKLRVEGSYTQAASGSLDVEVGGTGAGTTYDWLEVTGAATLDGTLTGSKLGTYSPPVGTSFSVITYASRTGGFATSDAQGFTISLGATAAQVVAVPVPPQAPSAPSATADSATAITLSWQDNSGDESGFEVDRATNSSFSQGLTTITTAANATAYQATGLTPSTTYYFRIRATGAAANSAYTATTSATTAAANEAPTVAADAAGDPDPVSGTTATLTVLGADDGGEAGLAYTWSVVGTPPAAVSFSANATNAAKVTTVTFAKAGTYSLQVVIADAGAATTTSGVTVTVAQTLTAITVSPASPLLAQNATQHFAATGHDQFGVAMATQPTFAWSVPAGDGTVDSNGLYTAPAHATTLSVVAASGAVSGSSSVTVMATIPAAPSNVVATPQPSGPVLVTWVRNSSDESGFIVMQSADGEPFVEVGRAPSGATSFAASGTAPGVDYEYQLYSFNDAGSAPALELAAATTPGIFAPANPYARVSDDLAHITLSWDDTADRDRGFGMQWRLAGEEWPADPGNEVTFDGAVEGRGRASGIFPPAGSTDTLAEGQQYEFRLRTVGTAGEVSAWSDVVSVAIERLAAPENLEVTSVTPSAVGLSWEGTAPSGGGFRVERSTDGTHYSPVGTVGPATTSFVADGLPGATAVHFRVQAFAMRADGGNNFSDYCAPAESKTLPSAPTNVTVSNDGPGEWSLSWQSTNTDPTGFEIEHVESGGSATVIPVGLTGFYSLGTLTPGLTHTFIVRASMGEDVSEDSAPAKMDVPNLPATPTNVTVRQARSGWLYVEWSGAPSNEQKTVVEASAGNPSFKSKAEVGWGVTHAVVKRPFGSATNTVTVRSENAAGYTPYATQTLIWPTNPYSGLPVAVSWTGDATASVRFDFGIGTGAWVYRDGELVGGRADYFVDENLPAGTTFAYTVVGFDGTVLLSTNMTSPLTWVDTPSVTPTPGHTGVQVSWTPVTGAKAYEVYGYPADYVGSTSFLRPLAVVGNETSYTLESLPPNTPMKFFIMGMGDNYSETIWHRDPATVTTGERAGASIVSATANSGTSATVIWSPPPDSSGLLYYKISGYAGDGPLPVVTVPADQSSYTFNELPLGREAVFQLVSYFANGEAGLTDQYDLTLPAYSAPAGFTATPLSSDSIRLSWQAIPEGSGHTGYTIERSTDGTHFQTVATVGKNQTTYLAASLSPDTEYIFRVRAAGGSLEGMYSDPARARPIPVSAGPVRLLPGFFEHQLLWKTGWETADVPSEAFPLGFTANFFGRPYDTVFVEENGALSLGSTLGNPWPWSVDFPTTAVIAPLLADVGRMWLTSGDVSYGTGTVDNHPAFAATWTGVAYEGYGPFTSGSNTFQVVLISRPDRNEGDFDIEFNYWDVRWESNGPDGLGYPPPTAGYSNGSGLGTSVFEFPGSGEEGAFLDDNALTGLVRNTLDAGGVDGRYAFRISSRADIDVDSNNTSTGDSEEAQAKDEEAIEDDERLPGKLIVVNDADRDNNQVPDFAEAPVGRDDSKTFVPVKVKLADNIDPATVWLSFDYAASNPADDNTDVDGAHFAAPGSLRLWTMGDDGQRTRSPITGSGGNFIPANTPIPAVWLSEGREYTLYLEAVRGSVTPGDLRIAVKLGTAEAGPFTEVDAVRVTAVAPAAASAETSGGVALFDGSVAVGDVDFLSNGYGGPFGQARTWTNRVPGQLASQAGNGVSVAAWPTLYQTSGAAFVSQGGDVLYFDRAETTDGVKFAARYGELDQLSYLAGSDEFVLTAPDGAQTRFYGFTGDVRLGGTFKGYSDPGGNAASVTARTADQKIKQITRGGQTFEFRYFEEPGSPRNGRLRTVQLVNGTTAVYTVAYDYYVDGDKGGNPGDLKLATVTNKDEVTIDRTYYRYYKKGEANGYAGALKLVLGLEGLARLGNPSDLSTLQDLAVRPFSDHYFEYDAARRVSRQYIQGLGPTNVNGPASGPLGYDYAPSDTNGASFHSEKFLTTEQFPDGTTRAIHANYVGLTIEEVVATSWKTSYAYDDSGRLVRETSPGGLATVWDYYTGTESGPLGYLQEVRIAPVGGGTEAKQQTLTYTDREFEGVTIQLPNKVTTYRNGNSDPIETSYTYDPGKWQRFLSKSVTEDLPAVSDSSYGQGGTGDVVREYDSYGRLETLTDADGKKTKWTYDNPTGAVKTQTVDADGLSLTTTIIPDKYGRPLNVAPPGGAGHATLFIYDDQPLKREVDTISPRGELSRTITDLATGTTTTEITSSAGATVLVGAATYDLAGRLVTQKRYPTPSTAYVTSYSYDTMGRLDTVTDPTGTKTQNHYDAVGRLIGTSVGVGTSMTRVKDLEYDEGVAGGDGNLTKVTLHPGGGSPDRVTSMHYDTRNRVDRSTTGSGGEALVTEYQWNNFGQVKEEKRYTTNGSVASTTTNEHDARGRLHRTTTAAGGYTIVATSWYDHRGNPTKSADPGGLVTVRSFDGAGRATNVSFQNAGGHVFSETEIKYDADGNAIWQKTTDDGPAGARLHYSASFYDAAGRVTGTADYGTAAAPVPTPGSTAPGASDTVLVNLKTYDAGGFNDSTTDPRGTTTEYEYDNLGRVTRVTYAVGTVDVRRTEYEYTPLDQIDLVRAMVPSPGEGLSVQETDYIYGVSKTGGSAVDSNALLEAVRYPGNTGAPSPAYQDTENFGYNALGEAINKRERTGVLHTYKYDTQGRLTFDTVTNVQAAMDAAVTEFEYRYDQLGRPEHFISRGAGGVKNEVQRNYDALGQITDEYQSHEGPVVVGSTPRVHYEYEAANGGSRMTRMVYPDGRQLEYRYEGDDDTINRVTAVAQESDLEVYDYLGLGTVVRRWRPEPGVEQRYYSVPDAVGVDGYDGLDRFGRVTEQLWENTEKPAGDPGEYLDWIHYDYDPNTNVLLRFNNASGDEDGITRESFTYDQLDRVQTFDRALMSSTVFSRDVSWQYTKAGEPKWTDWHYNIPNGIYYAGTLIDVDSGNDVVRKSDGSSPNSHVNTFDAWGRLAHDTLQKLVGSSGTPSDRGTTDYSYDALGRRITEGAKHLYYSADGNIIEERVDDEATTQYVWSPALPKALVLSDRDADGDAEHVLEDRVYVQQDAQGSVISLADRQGNVVQRYLYSPYGQVDKWDADWQGAGSTEFSFLFEGQRYDWTTQLYHNNGGADFDPVSEKAVASDPAALAAVCNDYDPRMEGYRNDVGMEGMIPVYGSAKQAWFNFAYAKGDFGRGDYLGSAIEGLTGVANVINAAADVVLLKSAYSAVSKAGGRMLSRAAAGRTTSEAVEGLSRAARETTHIPGLNNEQLVNGLRGATKRSNLIADAIEDKTLRVQWFDTVEELRAVYTGKKPGVMAFHRNGVLHLVRDTRAFEMAVHEGVHGLAFIQHVGGPAKYRNLIDLPFRSKYWEEFLAQTAEDHFKAIKFRLEPRTRFGVLRVVRDDYREHMDAIDPVSRGYLLRYGL